MKAYIDILNTIYSHIIYYKKHLGYIWACLFVVGLYIEHATFLSWLTCILSVFFERFAAFLFSTSIGHIWMCSRR